MKCPKCQSENHEGMKFCGECGNKLEIRCSKCNQANPPLDEIHRFEGTINQFTGDGVMAIFGAPIAHEDHAQRACHAALAIQRAIEPYAEKLKTLTDS